MDNNTPVRPESDDLEMLLAEYARARSLTLRNQIVARHLYIARIIAKRFAGRGVEYDDLYQVASLALIKAVERYTLDKGVKFVSYATPTMVGEVKNYFRDKMRLIRLPRRGASLMRELEAAKTALEQKLLRSPNAEELAEFSGISLEDVLETLEMQSAAAPVSLNAATGEDDDSPSLDTLLGIEEEGYGDMEARDAVKRAMAHLDETQRRIIEGRFYENLSQRDLAARLHVSQMTISRAERKALATLREYLRER